MKNDPIISKWLEEQEDSAEMAKIIALTEKLDAPSKTSPEQAWEGLMDRINSEATDNERFLVPNTEKKNAFQWAYWAVGIAALFLVGFFGIRNTPNPISISAEANSILTYELPDQSMVTLSAGSSVSFIEKNWEDKRELSLIGEAFFEVEEGSQFTVITNSGEVAVLGTSFNVKQRDGLFEVSCATGKVAVSSASAQGILNPGQRARLTNNKLETKPISINEIGAWRTGDFYFDQTPLASVVKELERQFQIDITLSPDISERIYNGYFNKDNLTEALQLVFMPMGFKFEIEEKQVTVQ